VKNVLLKIKITIMKKVRFILKCLMAMGLFASFSGVMAQITVSGTVLDENKEPLVGATVILKGSNPLVGTVTDIDGKFTLKVNGPDDVLEIKMLSYLTQQIKVGNKTSFSVTLRPQAQELETVVKIGYGEIKKKDATGSVAIVDKEELTKIPAASFDKALQGRAPGVMVTATSGAPGSGPSVKIRGVGSINSSSEPLYVIDGVPVNMGVDAGGVNPLTSISPEDIESISILKDASATAIYGSRGANGVVIITTKRGASGAKKNVVSVSAFTGFSRFPKYLDVMNADQYSKYIAAMWQAAGENFAKYSYTTDSARRANAYSWGDLVNTDWQRAITRVHAPLKSYNMSVSGGGANSNFSIGGNYYKEDGVMINEWAQRYGLRANSDFKVSDWIKVGESMNVSRNDQQSVPNMLGTALIASPLMPIYNSNNAGGFMGPEPRYVGTHDVTNPIAEMTYNKTLGTNTRLLSNIYTEITPTFLKGLKYRFDYGYDYILANASTWIPIYELPINGNRGHNYNELTESSSRNRRWNITNTLTYNTSFGTAEEGASKPHNLLVMVGQEAMADDGKTFSATGLKFSDENYNVLDMADSGRYPKGSVSSYRLYSYLFRGMYDYKGKYLLTINVRNDVSSKFGPKNRSGWFPSFSLGWKFNEDFLQDYKDKITMAKVRVGWGQTGNDNIRNYAYAAFFDPPDHARYPLGIGQVNNYGMQLYSSFENPYVKWEATTMTNFGLDVSLFENKIQFTGEYYIKTQDGMLVQNPMPIAAGRLPVANPWVNLGKIQNKGFEFNVLYRKQEGDFNYSVNLNLTTIRNKVLDLPAGSLLNTIGSDLATYTAVGFPVGAYYGYICEGIFKSQEEVNKWAKQDNAAPGDLKFKDLNGDRKIDQNDRTIIGKSIPDLLYGINFDCSYKGFDFTVFFQGVQGVDIYNQTRVELLGPKNYQDQNKLAEILNYWSPTNPNSNIPRLDKEDKNNNRRMSTYFLENGSFLRVKNIQLGYTLPKSILEKVNITRTRVYVSASNLYTITKYKGYDPEVGSKDPLSAGIDNGFYPIPKVFTAGVQLDF